jgi:hypothetical protein
MPASPSRKPSPHQCESPINNLHHHRRKEEEDPHLHIKDTTRAKLEQLRSTRLICHPEVTKLDMHSLQKKYGLKPTSNYH